MARAMQIMQRVILKLSSNLRGNAGLPGVASFSSQKHDTPMSENDHVLPYYNNRNPRNLEKLRIGYKHRGYPLDEGLISYWNKLFWIPSKSHCSAEIRHYEKGVVVSASTKEWCIRKHLYSAKDAAAADNIGRILARRCLQTGINEVFTTFTEEDKENSEKLRLFLKSMEEGGICLKEYKRHFPPNKLVENVPQPPPAWEITEEMINQIDEAKDKALPPKKVIARGMNKVKFRRKNQEIIEQIRNLPAAPGTQKT